MPHPKGVAIALAAAAWATFSTPALAVCAGAEAVPRRVLALHDGRAEPDPRESAIARHLGAVLHHEGLVLNFVDVSRPLPQVADARPLAGVLTWFPGEVERPIAMTRWIDGVLGVCGGPLPVVAVGHPGVPSGVQAPDVEAHFTRLGIAAGPGSVALSGGARPRTVHAPVVGLEADLLLPAGLYPRYRARAGAEALVTAATVDGDVVDLGTRGDRGLWLHEAAALGRDPRGGAFWIADPFALVAALAPAPDVPVPDTTTRTGRRIALVTIHPEGWSERSDAATGRQGPAAYEVLASNILPTGEGLWMTLGLPDDGRLSEGGISTQDAFARLAELSGVLPAARAGGTGPGAVDAALSAARDIGDEEPDLLLWPEGSLASPEALLAATRAGLSTFGGGPPTGETLAEVSPAVGVRRGRVQVYARTPSTRPAWGDSTGLHGAGARLMEQEAMAHRLLPDHFSFDAGAVLNFGGRSAVLRALGRLRGARHAPVTGAAYADMVRGSRAASIVPDGRGAWRIERRGELATVRVDEAGLGIDLDASEGVLGARRVDGHLYVALDPAAMTPRVVMVPATGAMQGRRPGLVESGPAIMELVAEGCAVTVMVSGPGRSVWQVAPGAMVEITLDGETERRAADASGALAVDAVGAGAHALRLGC